MLLSTFDLKQDVFKNINNDESNESVKPQNSNSNFIFIIKACAHDAHYANLQTRLSIKWAAS